ncbi:hypothetical protein MRX96_040163 [Rhipicephalus microplus]
MFIQEFAISAGVAAQDTMSDCFSPPDINYCTGLSKLWYFDPEDRQCKMFYWGGCFNNRNRYRSERACKEACRIRPRVSPVASRPTRSADEGTTLAPAAQ